MVSSDFRDAFVGCCDIDGGDGGSIEALNLGCLGGKPGDVSDSVGAVP